MKIQINSIYIFALLLLLSACGGKAYLNTNYRNWSPSNKKIALYPVKTVNNKITDQNFREIFEKNSMNVVFIGDDRLKIRNKALVLKVAEVINANPEKPTPLTTLFNEDELTEISKIFNNASLLVVPSSLIFTETLGRTFINSAFYVYDLSNGELIYRNMYSFNANISGEPAIFILSRITASQLVEDLKTRFN